MKICARLTRHPTHQAAVRMQLEMPHGAARSVGTERLYNKGEGLASVPLKNFVDQKIICKILWNMEPKNGN
jgi:hypothetical protein